MFNLTTETLQIIFIIILLIYIFMTIIKYFIKILIWLFFAKNNQIEILQNKFETLQNNYNNLQNKCEDYENKFQTLEKKFDKKLNIDIDEMQKLIYCNNEDIEILKNSFETLQTNYNNLQNNNCLIGEINHLQLELKIFKNDFFKNEVLLEKIVKKYEKQNELLMDFNNLLNNYSFFEKLYFSNIHYGSYNNICNKLSISYYANIKKDDFINIHFGKNVNNLFKLCKFTDAQYIRNPVIFDKCRNIITDTDNLNIYNLINDVVVENSSTHNINTIYIDKVFAMKNLKKIILDINDVSNMDGLIKLHFSHNRLKIEFNQFTFDSMGNNFNGSYCSGKFAQFIYEKTEKSIFICHIYQLSKLLNCEIYSIDGQNITDKLQNHYLQNKHINNICSNVGTLYSSDSKTDYTTFTNGNTQYLPKNELEDVISIYLKKEENMLFECLKQMNYI